ncbi:MAG TPA: PxKF domain-containing protein [Solirubrobacteraceae bacterium]|nr:PxKF domain-containing protein [Solirubrobacteraceae bacterium]
MSRAVRALTLCVVAALLTLTASQASAATPAKVGPPNSMAAIGDSITKAFHSGSWLTCPPYINTDCPARSWSTGTDSDVNSHYLRIRAINSAINGRNFNEAVTGAKVDTADDQAREAVKDNAELVTMLIGANDVCASTEAGMTSVANFRTRVAAALNVLRTGLPNARIYVVSIPDIKRLWSIGKDSATARLKWSTLNICQAMLANPTSTSAADNARRDRVQDRNEDFNTVLREECDKLVHCRHDGGAGYRIAFTSSDMSNIDFFHPNVDGQRDAATATWNAGYNYADRTAPVTTIAPERAPDGRDGWYRDDVAVSLDTADNADESEYFYKLQGAVDTAWRRYTGPFTITDEGVTEISARSVDVNGNIEASKQSLVRIDKTAPTFTLACPTSAVLGSAASFRIVGAADDRSGFAGSFAEPRPMDTTVPGLALPNTVEIQDRAGNTATRSCAYDVTYPAPEAPALDDDSASPNAGAFSLTWDAPADPATHPLRYTLERRAAAASGTWEQVAADLDARSRRFAAGDRVDEGVWVYRVRGTDGTQDTPWSPASAAVTVDQTGPNAPAVAPAREPEFAGDGGWFADAVDVVTTDNGDPALRDGSAGTGVDPASVAERETLTASGTVSRTVSDRVGNRSAATSLAVQIDGTAPQLEVACPATATLLTDASATVAARDGQSGLRDDPSGAVALDTTKIGPQTVERTAVDRVGHATTERCTTVVEYPTPGTPRVGEGESPSAGTYTVGWEPSAPASYPIRYVVERRAATDAGEWAPVADELADPSLAFTAGNPEDEGTWRYRVKGVDGDVETAWSPASEPVVVDQSAPAAPSIAADRAPEYAGAGAGGWYRDAVTLTTTGNGDPALRDGTPGTGVDPASVAAPVTLTASGTVTRTVRDRVGNESAPATAAVKIDAAAPSLTLDCPTSVALRGSGAVTVRATDDGSGLAQDPSGTVAVDTSKVGPQTIERTAVDRVGHTVTQRCTVIVRYEFGGLESPVERDGTSVFKQGSTVPLKFSLTDAAGRVVTDARPTVQLERLVGTTVVETVDATATNGKPVTLNGKHYQLNLSTKPLAAGSWNVKLTLGDGTVQRTAITLR